MTAALPTAHYSGIYVHDIWQNNYLISKDLLTCHDLVDCECPLMQCPLQAEYFLRQIEPAATRQQNWLEIYHYAQGVKTQGGTPSPEQLLKIIAQIVASGELRVFKMSDGSSSIS